MEDGFLDALACLAFKLSLIKGMIHTFSDFPYIYNFYNYISSLTCHMARLSSEGELILQKGLKFKFRESQELSGMKLLKNIQEKLFSRIDLNPAEVTFGK